MSQYSIGVDFGTLSARALLVDVSDGAELAQSEFVYPHAVMTDNDFCGVHLLKTDAFQHPQDYLDAFAYVVRDVTEKSGVNPCDIAGIGIDFTSCTPMPVKADGTPLCFLEEFKNEPQSYVKLWKHHSAEKEAEEITRLALDRGEEWLESYGGKVSSEWLFPKLLEIYRKAPKVYAECDMYMEAADWLVFKLTGNNIRSSCMAGYKGLWNKSTAYPSNKFWAEIDEGFGDIIGTRISENVKPAGTKAGEINEYASHLTGLAPGTAVAVPLIDAHTALPASGIVDGGKLMIIAGTSSCHIVMSETENKVKGICGSVADGIVPGFVAYEAGQAGVGDSFDWFVKNCVPPAYYDAAKEKGMGVFDYLTQKAEELAVGESGLLALDWWNGNRTPYADYDLTGTIIGLNLQTKPEEIYRAIIESTAYGTKQIVDLYEANGVEINEIYISGGISQKNSFMMQMYADVLGKEVKISSCSQAGAKGSAVFAAFAGACFADIASSADIISEKAEKTYFPIEENTKKYQLLYKQYLMLSEYFSQNDIMKKIKGIG